MRPLELAIVEPESISFGASEPQAASTRAQKITERIRIGWSVLSLGRGTKGRSALPPTRLCLGLYLGDARFATPLQAACWPPIGLCYKGLRTTQRARPRMK